ncbi:hypothetical protein E2C01_090591 [Portunus trituberculatus]|uniref:Uncharacterized protein n=1 Tax=Portunus trituberculatus TaxID=210409 RepID=A0A5B7JLS0_PORTR|nr:hypothetical protein [Portunus trituberculatus]
MVPLYNFPLFRASPHQTLPHLASFQHRNLHTPYLTLLSLSLFLPLVATQVIGPGDKGEPNTYLEREKQRLVTLPEPYLCGS